MRSYYGTKEIKIMFLTLFHSSFLFFSPVLAAEGYKTIIELKGDNIENKKFNMRTILKNVNSEFFQNKNKIKTAYIVPGNDRNDFIAIIRVEEFCYEDVFCPVIVHRNSYGERSNTVIFAKEHIEMTLLYGPKAGHLVPALVFEANNAIINVIITKKSTAIFSAGK